MPQAYDAPASPSRPANRETRDAAPVGPAGPDVERLAAVLAETATLPALLARTASPVRFIPTAYGDPCGACPQTGPDARTPAAADAILCHFGMESGYTYREPVCLACLPDAAAYELRLPDAAVWVEVPVLLVAAPPVWSGCFCNPSYGQSCEVCDGTLAERAGLL